MRKKWNELSLETLVKLEEKWARIKIEHETGELVTEDIRRVCALCRVFGCGECPIELTWCGGGAMSIMTKQYRTHSTQWYKNVKKFLKVIRSQITMRRKENEETENTE